jgi:hypothetical protein
MVMQRMIKMAAILFLLSSCVPWSFVTIKNKSQHSIIIECITACDISQEPSEILNGISYNRVQLKNDHVPIVAYFAVKPIKINPNEEKIVLRINTVDFIYILGFGEWKTSIDQKTKDAINAIDDIFSEINIYSNDGNNDLLADKTYLLTMDRIKLDKNSLPDGLIVRLIFQEQAP